MIRSWRKRPKTLDLSPVCASDRGHYLCAGCACFCHGKKYRGVNWARIIGGGFIGAGIAIELCVLYVGWNYYINGWDILAVILTAIGVYLAA